ncbi:sensor histidine kinase [Aquabacterium sp.]|uniref:sensor histidine kinase n=1 Tax=Aquabacterium sp. TaxID=1872578 RepID=UPI003BF5BCC7
MTIWDVDIAPRLVTPADAESTQWHPVELDHAWRRKKWCDAPISTYRFQFHLDTVPKNGLGLYLRRAGNRLTVWINQEPAARFGALNEPNADFSNLPLFAPFAWHALKPGLNTVLIQVAGDCRRYSGLAHMDIGPRDVVEPVQQSARRARTYPTVGIVSVCGLLAVAGFAFATMTRQRIALFFGLSNGLWAIRAALWGMTDLPMPYSLWFFLIDATYAAWMSLVVMQCLWLVSVQKPWLERLQWLALAFMLVTSITAATGHAIWLKALGLEATMLSAALAMLSIIYEAIRRPKETNVAMSLATLPMFVLAVWDHWNVWLSGARDAYQRYYYSPLLVLFMLVAITLLMMRQFQLAMRNDEQYRRSLEQEVERQRAELQVQHERERARAQQTAVMAERQRIVRDMHDGLGAQLAGMLAVVRSDQAIAQELEADIASAIAHLRSTIDNLSTSETDLSTVLAQFRFHHEQRLKRAGLELIWQVELLPVPEWPSSALWELQQMLREAFANILKHARASTITVRADCRDGLCTICIQDDGCGFDPASVRNGRGMQHLRERATHIGLHFSLTSDKGLGTQIRWTWPLEHVPPTQGAS